jgi:hypothetical protein
LPPRAANDDTRILTGWRLEERDVPFSMSGTGPQGYTVTAWNARAVCRTGAEAQLGTFRSMAEAAQACRDADVAAPEQVFSLLWRFEELGIGPRDAEIIMRHAELCGQSRTGPGLSSLDCPYRIAAVQTVDASGFSGSPIGQYLGRTIMSWPKYGRDGWPLHERRRR